MLTVARVFKQNLKRLLIDFWIFDWIPHRWLWIVDEAVTKSAGQLDLQYWEYPPNPQINMGQYCRPGLEIEEESWNDSS